MYYLQFVQGLVVGVIATLDILIIVTNRRDKKEIGFKKPKPKLFVLIKRAIPDLFNRRDRQPGERHNAPDETIVFFTQLNMALLALTFSGLFGVAAVVVFSAPGGLPGLIGSYLAGFCASGVQCDLSILMSAFAVANIVMAEFAVFFLYVVLGFSSSNEELDAQFEDIQDQIDAVHYIILDKQEVSESEI